MANRRMLSRFVIETDAFLDMPAESQALYAHLVIGADDDGFINNPNSIRRMTGFSVDSLKLLICKRFSNTIFRQFSCYNSLGFAKSFSTIKKDCPQYTLTKKNANY